MMRIHADLRYSVTSKGRKANHSTRHMTTKMNAKLLCAALLSIALLGLSAVMTFAVDATGTWRTEEDATVRVSNWRRTLRFHRLASAT